MFRYNYWTDLYSCRFLRLALQTDQFYDFYVIGFQEMVDLNAANVVLNLESGRRAREWNPLLLETVNRRASSRGMDFE